MKSVLDLIKNPYRTKTRLELFALDKEMQKAHKKAIHAANNSKFSKVCDTCGCVGSVTCPDKKHLGEKTRICNFYNINPHTEEGKNTVLFDACGRKYTIKSHFKIYDKYHAY